MARIKYLEAIGQTPKRGRPPVRPPPSKADLVKLYVNEGRSVREVAALLGCSKDAVHRAMRKYGLAARSRVRKSALLDYSLRNLEAGIRDKGLRGFARELGVDPGTIHHHLKTRKTKKRR